MPLREIIRSPEFMDDIKHLKDRGILEKLKKHIRKVAEDPEIGKPLRYSHKGARTVRVTPYRLLYAVEGDTIRLLRFAHRDKVYL